MQIFKRLVKKLILPQPRKAFYILVKCSGCGEEVKVRVNRSSDFQIEYNVRNPNHCYTIKKEMMGKNCYNLMRMSLALTKNAKLIFADAKGCKFIRFDKE